MSDLTHKEIQEGWDAVAYLKAHGLDVDPEAKTIRITRAIGLKIWARVDFLVNKRKYRWHKTI